MLGSIEIEHHALISHEIFSKYSNYVTMIAQCHRQTDKQTDRWLVMAIPHSA